MQFAFSLFSEKDMKKHLQVVGAILLKDGKVLAAKRGESKYAYVAHKYEFVGGKIEPGETPEDALVREVKEELCADIRVCSHFLDMTHEYPDFSITLHTYLCEFLSGFQSTEHEALRFLSAEELREEEWAPADVPALEKLRQYLTTGFENIHN